MKRSNYYDRYQHFLNLKLDKVESFRQIKKWSNGRKKIIDLGCGVGYLTNYLEGVGFDNNKEVIEKAKKLFPKTKFILADLSQKLPLKKKEVDCFVCYNLLEHLKDMCREKLFGEIRRTLTSDGILIVAYLDETFWFNRLLAVFMPNYGIKDPTHLVSWSPEDLRTELKKHFKILKENKTSQYGRSIFLTRFLKGEMLYLLKLK
ncbi:MAG: class I SAM-dependent methyltransferase [bacterium]|nr:class I SAM-dependent methyltransferase [bacterium]